MNSQAQNNKQISTEIEIQKLEYLKKFGLELPQNLNDDDFLLWKNFYLILGEGLLRKLILKEDINDFITNFINLKTFIEKQNYILDLKTRLTDAYKNYTETLSILSQQRIEEKIEDYKKTLPPEYAPLIDYIVYSYLTGTEVDEKLIDQALYELSPQGQEELSKAKIYQALEQSRRNPLKAANLDGGSHFNQTFSKEALAERLEANTESKPKTPVQTLPKKPPIQNSQDQTVPNISNQIVNNNPNPYPAQNNFNSQNQGYGIVNQPNPNPQTFVNQNFNQQQSSNFSPHQAQYPNPNFNNQQSFTQPNPPTPPNFRRRNNGPIPVITPRRNPNQQPNPNNQNPANLDNTSTLPHRANKGLSDLLAGN